MNAKKMVAMTVVAMVLTAGTVQADVFNMTGGLTSVEFVTVGNPGNAGEWSGGGGDSPGAIVGGVDYTFRMGKFRGYGRSVHGVPQRRRRYGYLRTVRYVYG